LLRISSKFKPSFLPEAFFALFLFLVKIAKMELFRCVVFWHSVYLFTPRFVRGNWGKKNQEYHVEKKSAKKSCPTSLGCFFGDFSVKKNKTSSQGKF
jgi:hypothetical protein